MPHESCKISALSAKRFSGHFRKNLYWGINLLSRRGLKLSRQYTMKFCGYLTCIAWIKSVEYLLQNGRYDTVSLSFQSQFQQREAAERQKRLAQLAPVRAAPPETARPAAVTERTVAAPVSRAAAPPRQLAAARGRVTNGGGAATVSAGGRAASTGSAASSTASGGGKVRAMFQTRRTGTAASSAPAQQTSPIGWDKSYPLDPIKKSAPARSSAPPPAAVSELVHEESATFHRTLSDDDLRAGESTLRGGSVRSSVTMPELTMPAIHVEREKPTPQQRKAERQRINAELRRRDHELLARIKDQSQQQCGPLAHRPIRVSRCRQHSFCICIIAPCTILAGTALR